MNAPGNSAVLTHALNRRRRARRFCTGWAALGWHALALAMALGVGPMFSPVSTAAAVEGRRSGGAGGLLRNGSQVVMLGDSLTEGEDPDGYVNTTRLLLAEVFPDRRIFVANAGKGGDTAVDMAARSERDVLRFNPDWVTLSAGVNDIQHGLGERSVGVPSRGVPLPVFRETVLGLIQRLRSHGSRVALFTGTVIQEDLSSPGNAQMEQYAEALREVARATDSLLVDTRAAFRAVLEPKQRPGLPLSGVLTGDGVHLVPEGNWLMAKTLVAAWGGDAERIEQAKPAVQERIREQRERLERNLARYAQANRDAGLPTPGRPRVVIIGPGTPECWGLATGAAKTEILDREIAGETLRQLRMRFHQDVVALKPGVVVILPGPCLDLEPSRGLSRMDVESHLARIARLAKGSGIRVALGSLTPVSDAASGSTRSGYATVSEVRSLNDRLRRLCEENCYLFVDCFGPVADRSGRWKRGLSEDGIHPNAAGAAVLGGTIESVVQSLVTIEEPALPARLRLPDPKIAQVYQANWENTLVPCRTSAAPVAKPSPHVEPRRPWKVDVQGHYPGWYPGVDVKHLATAYLACERNFPLVLRAWELTVSRYLLSDGSVRPMTMDDNPHSVVPETTVDGGVVFYPLRTTANIDLLLLGDLIYRFSQDRTWLRDNLPALRKAAAFLEQWMDDEGLLHSDSYDLDQVYREIDGVAQASAFLAFRRLAGLEWVAGNPVGERWARRVAGRLERAANRHFWDPVAGYYVEHLVYNNVARTGRLGSIGGVSSELDSDHRAALAIDGVTGIGIDAFGVGTGVAGHHEWAANGQTEGAWIRVDLREPTRVGKVILINRTDPRSQPGERFATGVLEFSDGSSRVPVVFNRLDVSRAVVAFAPRTVTWVRFVGTGMQGVGGRNAGLAEFTILPADEPYRRVSHGMTDSSLAMLAFGVAGPERAAEVWRRFREQETGFYEVGGLAAPTWIASKAETYGAAELNRRAPYKDCVAMARTWRYDALMRHRYRDGDGLVRTLGFANTLFERPSGGGVGLFAERYGLGRFQPGDEAQATIPAYAEYPAVYNAIVVQQALLGLDVGVDGTVTIDPVVPASWFEAGFGAERCGLRRDRDFGFTYRADRFEGWVEGAGGSQRLRVRLPPGLEAGRVTVTTRDATVRFRRRAGVVGFELALEPGARTPFVIRRAGQE